MYTVRVKRHFDSAHALRGYGGKCENLHGHRWQIVVAVASEALDDVGLAFDFTELKRELDAILARFDHQFLNEIPPFDELNPSSEHIAHVVFDELQSRVPQAKIIEVEAWESPDAWATFTP